MHFLRKPPLAAMAVLAATVPAGVMGSVNFDGGNVAELIREVKQEVERNSSEVRQTAEKAMAESKKSGEVSQETKALADKLLIQQNTLSEGFQKIQAALDTGLKDHAEQMLELEQKLSANGGGKDRASQSFGHVLANHEDVRAFASAGSKGTTRIEVSHAITSAGASAGELIYSDRETGLISLPRRETMIRDLLTVGRTSSNLVEYMKQLSRSLNAAPTAETTQKPESDLTYEKAEAAVRTIAHWIAVSRQAMDDAAQLETEIDTELRYGLELAEDVQLLTGDGTGENLSGLITNATAYDGAREANIANATMIDRLRVALLEASLALYPADGIVLHPADWMYIETSKDGDNRYIFANPLQMAGPVLWGRRVAPTLAMAEDKFLTGAFRMAGTIYDRMETEVLLSSEDRDNFVKNMLTVRAEKRLAFAVKRPAALIYGDFGNIA